MHGLREATETRKNFNKDSGRLLPFCYVDCNTQVYTITSYGKRKKLNEESNSEYGLQDWNIQKIIVFKKRVKIKKKQFTLYIIKVS